MPIQFPAERINYMDPSRVVDAVQRKEWNTLRQQGERDRQEIQAWDFDEGKRRDNALWLASATDLGMKMTPQQVRSAWPEFAAEYERRGFDVSKLPDVNQLSDEDLMQGFSTVNNAARMIAAGRDEEDRSDLSSPEKNFQRRQQLVAQYGEDSEQVRVFDNYVRSPRIASIAGVPTAIGAAGSTPLSTQQRELDAIYEQARSRADGTNSVIPAGARIEVSRKFPRMQAARRDLKNALMWNQQIEQNWLLQGGPAQGRALALTEEGQAFQQAVDGLFSHIQSLTRVPGVGAQSDWEGRIAQAPLPNLGMWPNVRRQAFQTYFDIIDDLEAAVARVSAGNADQILPDDAGGGAAPQPTGRTATNPQTGETLREMSDGSWVP